MHEQVILDKWDEYFANTPKDKIVEDAQEIRHSKQGITHQQYFNNLTLCTSIQHIFPELERK